MPRLSANGDSPQAGSKHNGLYISAQGSVVSPKKAQNLYQSSGKEMGCALLMDSTSSSGKTGFLSGLSTLTNSITTNFSFTTPIKIENLRPRGHSSPPHTYRISYSPLTEEPAAFEAQRVQHSSKHKQSKHREKAVPRQSEVLSTTKYEPALNTPKSVLNSSPWSLFPKRPQKEFNLTSPLNCHSPFPLRSPPAEPLSSPLFASSNPPKANVLDNEDDLTILHCLEYPVVRHQVNDGYWTSEVTHANDAPSDPNDFSLDSSPINDNLKTPESGKIYPNCPLINLNTSSANARQFFNSSPLSPTPSSPLFTEDSLTVTGLKPRRFERRNTRSPRRRLVSKSEHNWGGDVELSYPNEQRHVVRAAAHGSPIVSPLLSMKLKNVNAGNKHFDYSMFDRGECDTPDAQSVEMRLNRLPGNAGKASGRFFKRGCSSESGGSSQNSFHEPLGITGILKSHPILSSLFVFLPIGIASYFMALGDGIVFSTNFIAIIPMAWLMGKATEDIACHMGQVAGGLLNAWFGNVVEMLICIAGLRRGELVVVRSTLIGSILSNLLLVTGCSFFFGGMKHKVQEFSAIGASTNASLMTLSCMCLGLPTIYAALLSSASPSVLHMSRTVSFFLIFIYVQYLIFQLGTHSFLFAEEDDEVADLSLWGAGVLLITCSLACSFCSDFLVASIEGVVTKFDLSKEFIGIILLPIVGNAAEHYTSVIVAMRNKMDLSLACAVGSSCQVALFVTPFCVLVGWVLDEPMSLDLHAFEFMVLVMSVLIITSILQDGYSHWLEGSMLLSAYCVIAIMYFFEDPQFSEII